MNDVFDANTNARWCFIDADYFMKVFYIEKTKMWTSIWYDVFKQEVKHKMCSNILFLVIMKIIWRDQ